MRAGMMMRWPCGSRGMARCCGCLRKSGMDRLMNMAAGQDRELKSAAIADGARNNGTCLESVTPDIRLIDVGQACQVSQGRGRCR